MTAYRSAGHSATEVHGRILQRNVEAGTLLGAPSRADLWDALDAFDDVTLDALDAGMDEMDRLGIKQGRFFTELLLETEWTSGREVRDALAVAIAIANHSTGEPDTWSVFKLAQGLQAYQSIFPNWVPGELHGRDLRVAQALVQVTSLAYSPYEEISLAGPVLLPLAKQSNGSPGWSLSDPELVTLIADHVDRANEIVEYAKDRRSMDTAGLRVYLDNRTALRTGTL